MRVSNAVPAIWATANNSRPLSFGRLGSGQNPAAQRIKDLSARRLLLACRTKMRRVISWLALILGSCHVMAGERVIDFSKFPLNQAPAGFRSVVSGRGNPGDWRIIVEPGAATGTNTAASSKPVLAQLSQDGTDEHFPMLVFEEESYGDFTLTTRFKLVDGLFEQMAGVAFRMQDTNNYYYVRASALGNTFRFIKLVNGQRLTTLGPSVEIQRGAWHELSIDCKGNRIRCLLDGQELIPPLNDNSFTAGKIAFWTKSDAVSYFGDTRIVYTPHETLAQILVREGFRQYPRLVGLKIYSPQGESGEPKIVASSDEADLGQVGGKVERDVIAHDVIYSGKAKGAVLVTMALHDRNGEVVGAVRVVMKSFTGQTEQNALARAQPVVKEMEKRIRTAKDLVQ